MSDRVKGVAAFLAVTFGGGWGWLLGVVAGGGYWWRGWCCGSRW
jgi:hypothetical protein